MLWTRKIGVTLAGAALLWIVTPPAGTETQTDPATVGQWSSAQTWPIVSVHAQMLPTGKVMFYPYSDEPHLWDPSTAQITSTNPAGFNLFCTGHSWMADGRLFVSGGHISNEVGLPNAAIYNPSTGAWSRLPDMNAGRWYPTNTTLPNGDVLVVSGVIDRTVWNNPLPQVWETAAGAWRDLNGAELVMPLYPFMFVSPDGRVFNAGPNRDTKYLDVTGRGRWSAVADSNFGLRDYGSAVMFDRGKVLIVGGGDPPTATAETIDLTSGNPQWTYVTPMSTPRRQNNATVLPDGKVLVTGGSSGTGFDNASAAVHATEMWDPIADRWTQMAPISQYRGYHSIAMLLPDGRVLSAGGDNHASAEVYSPPYLFRGARPAISSAPTNVTWGQPFEVQTPDAASISSVSLIRLSSVTHAFDQDQRFARLTFSASGGALQVNAPATANDAPPGPYLLFVLNGQDVPSVGRIIYLGTQAAPSGPGSPTGLTATAVSATRVNLTWTDGAANEDGFKIERALDTSSTFAEIGSVGINSTAFSDLTVQPATTYTYRVRAFNTAGSALSNTASVTTPAPTGTGGRRRFNGTTDYIDFPAAPQVNTATFAFFFTPLSLPASGERDILMTYAEEGQAEPFGTHDKQLFLTSTGTLKARVYAGGNVIAVSSTPLTVGQRYHVGVTISSTTLTVYINGVARGTAPTTGSYANYSNPLLRLAGRPQPVEAGAPSARAHGDFTQFGEWNVALSAAEMASLAGGAAVSTVQPGAVVVAASLTSEPPTAEAGGPLVANGTTFVTESTPPPTAPAAPTGLTATAASAARVNLAWTDAASNEDGFRIERAPGATMTFVEIGSAGANATGFSDLTTQPSTTYVYRVVAFNSAGSAASNGASVTTPAATGTGGRRRFNGTTDYIDFPSAPQVNTATFAFFFTPLSLPAAGERDILITYAEGGEAEPFSTHDKQLFLTSTGTLKARVYSGALVIAASSTPLTVGQRYHVGMTISSTTLTVYVNGVARGTAPTAGSYANYSDPMLRLAGRPESVEAGAPSTRAHGDFTQFGEWNVALTAAEMASLAGGAAVTSVQPGAIVVAASLTDDPPSAQAGGPLLLNGTTFVSDTTPGPGPTPPAAPTGLTAKAPSTTRVNLAWTDASTNEDGFRIERAPGGTTTFAEIGRVGPNVTSFSDLTAQPSTTYVYRVLAFNAAGSAASNSATATTRTPKGSPDAAAEARASWRRAGVPLAGSRTIFVTETTTAPQRHQ